MTNQEFYDIIDRQIEDIISQYASDPELGKKSETGKKSYGFLLWFLKNNLNQTFSSIEDYRPYIVDGNDDNSCDLIFSNTENGEPVYYVIQAKWFAKSNCEKTNEIANIYKACLLDFSMILHHKKAKSPTNKKFNSMYSKLKKHTDENGKVRFLLVALCNTDPSFRIEELNEYINNPLVKTEIFDIVSLKNSYIDCNYRGYNTDNPLASLDPINNKITIKFLNHLTVEEKNAYIFILSAKEIYNLYEKFGTRLFLKNVRNPLLVDENKQMEQSASQEPQHFFSYNNGLTGITNYIHDFYDHAQQVSLEGLQIINGAQTVKSIYNAYSTATKSQRLKMDKYIKISLKVIKADDTAYQTNIIRYTNTQSKIIPRDYHSNDEIQKKIYYDLLRDTDIIYERKRGEFTEKSKKSLNVVSNLDMAQCYIAFYMQDPYLAKTAKKDIFDDSNKIYDTIFTNSMDYRDLVNSYYIFQYVDTKISCLEAQCKDKSAPSHSTLSAQYALIKDGRYYITALIHKVYIEFDAWFNSEYTKAKTSKKDLTKEALARSILFSKLKTDSTFLDASYEKVVSFIVDYASSLRITNGNDFYKKASTYEDWMTKYVSFFNSKSIS